MSTADRRELRTLARAGLRADFRQEAAHFASTLALLHRSVEANTGDLNAARRLFLRRSRKLQLRKAILQAL